MTKEHLIWRPNDISPEVWERMSREEQVNWWKARTSRAIPKMHMRETVRLYDECKITLSEFVSLVCKVAVLEEIEEFLRTCPPDLLATLQDSLADYGDDEADWPRTFHMGSHFPWVTAEEVEETNCREQEQIWRGARLLKKYLFRC